MLLTVTDMSSGSALALVKNSVTFCYLFMYLEGEIQGSSFSQNRNDICLLYQVNLNVLNLSNAYFPVISIIYMRYSPQ